MLNIKLYVLHSSIFILLTYSISNSKHVFSIRVENGVDPDQMASLEASWSGLTLFQKEDTLYNRVQNAKGMTRPSEYWIDISKHSLSKSIHSVHLWEHVRLSGWIQQCHTKKFFRFSPTPTPMKYKQIKKSIICLKTEKNVCKRLKIWVKFFWPAFFFLKTNTKNLVIIWTLDIYHLGPIIYKFWQFHGTLYKSFLSF